MRSGVVLERVLIGTAALAVIWIVTLALLGMPVTGPDAYDHLHWIFQVNQQMDSGNFYPRWMPGSFAGLGLPIFYFYPILPYWIAWLVHSASSAISVNQIYNLTSVLVLVLSGVAGYLYFKTFAKDRWKAIGATILYCGLPYRFVDIHIRSAFSEQLTFVWLPILFYAIDLAFRSHEGCTKRELRARQSKIIILGALAWAGLAMSNIPSLALMMWIAPLYVVLRLFIRSNGVRTLDILFPIGYSAITGALIAGVALIPAIGFQSLIHDDFVYGPIGINYFFALYDVIALNHSNLFFLNAMMVLIGMVGLVAFKSKVIAYDPRSRAWTILLAVAVFLQLPWLSVPIWEYLPLFNLIQFSTRLNIVLCLGLPICFIAIESRREKSVVLALTTLLMVVSYVHGHSTVKEAWHSPKIEATTFATRDAPEYLPRTTGNDYFAIHERALKMMDGSEIVAQQDSANISAHRDLTRTTFSITLQNSDTLHFHRLYWPTWQLTLDRKAWPIFPDSNGQVAAVLPAGTHNGTLSIAESSYEKIGAWLSVFGIFSLSYLACIWLTKGRI